MDSELIAVCVIQVIVLVVVIAAIIYYLLRNVMLRSLHDDVHDKTIVITGCDSGLGWYLARHCDQLGFRVYAGCCNPAGEGAVQLLSEASARLQTIAIDVTSTDSLNSALNIIRQQLPTSAKGNLHCRIKKYIKTILLHLRSLLHFICKIFQALVQFFRVFFYSHVLFQSFLTRSDNYKIK